ncbi:MAG TPA: hypothetical protein VLC95_15800, partial [Anaerolineae bacterium]|nr:hypothetical protein [Anaerolineae bacterium]
MAHNWKSLLVWLVLCVLVLTSTTAGVSSAAVSGDGRLGRTTALAQGLMLAQPPDDGTAPDDNLDGPAPAPQAAPTDLGGTPADKNLDAAAPPVQAPPTNAVGTPPNTNPDAPPTPLRPPAMDFVTDPARDNTGGAAPEPAAPP